MIFTRSRRLLAVVLLILAAGLFLSAGRLVSHEDPLEKSDAIYVLGGTWATRWVEGADLYREGYAPLILLSPDFKDAGQRALEQRGTPIPRAVDLMRNLMITRVGIPANAVTILPGQVDNTAQEAETVAAFVAANHWHRLIVITDRATTRRAGYAFRRILGPDVQVIMRASRYDTYHPGDWWKTRQSFRQTFYDFPKLVAYWLGLRG